MKAKSTVTQKRNLRITALRVIAALSGATSAITWAVAAFVSETNPWLIPLGKVTASAGLAAWVLERICSHLDGLEWERRLADTKLEVERTKREIAQSGEMATELQVESVCRRAPRTIGSKEQRDKIASELKEATRPQSVVLWVCDHNEDTTSLADEFNSVFKAADWHCDFFFPLWAVSGVSMEVIPDADNELMASAKKLFELLDNSELTIVMEPRWGHWGMIRPQERPGLNSGYKDAPIRIIIGEKKR